MVDYTLQMPWLLVLIGYLAFSCDNNNKGKDWNTHINYILLHTLFCKYNLGNMFLWIHLALYMFQVKDEIVY